MNEIKLISTDLDGTLLNRESAISEKNKIALMKCIDNGVKVVISSGRSKENIKGYMNDLGITNGYGSAFHGATIFKLNDNNIEIVNETILEKEVAQDILKKLITYDDIGILVYTPEQLYSIDSNEYVNSYYQKTPVEVKIIDNFSDIKEEISKILIKGDRNHLLEIRDKFLDLNKNCRMLFSELDLLEFMSIDTNKGFGLEKICELENINIANTIAIGDNFNDIEMIEKAGIGVSVKNAVTALKEKSDYVTNATNNEDAIYEVVEKFFPN